MTLPDNLIAAQEHLARIRGLLETHLGPEVRTNPSALQAFYELPVPVCAAIVLEGYRERVEPMMLTTIEQVQACALRAVVVDAEGDAWQLVTDDEDDGARVWRSGVGDAYELGLHLLPAALLAESGPLRLVWAGGEDA